MAGQTHYIKKFIAEYKKYHESEAHRKGRIPILASGDASEPVIAKKTF
jgi:hypothetical protein